MSVVLLATSNRGKAKEFKKLLQGHFNLVTTSDPPAIERCPTPPRVPETGTTYFENVLVKALRYFEIYRLPVLADDSGLEVDCLSGRPGVDSAILGGETLSAAERWAVLLAEIRRSKVPQPWTARFRSVLCFYDGKSVPVFAHGTSEGRILPEPLGTEGFGYDPVFFSSELGQGFGVASEVDKNRVSHRAKAVQSLLALKA
jgi:XTP/dITP diphosphohydrolase